MSLAKTLYVLILSASLAVPAYGAGKDQNRLAMDHCADAPGALDDPKPDGIEAIISAEPGTYPEEEVTSAMLKSAAIDVARGARTAADCKMIMQQGQSLFQSALTKAEKGIRKKRHKLSRKPEIQKVQRAIIDLWVADQSARFAYVSLNTEDKSGADFWAQRLATAHARNTDEASRLYMKSLLEEWDWIDRRRFGDAVSDHAWILVQHSDADPAFQQMVLQRMQPLLKDKSIRPKHYAYLWDRVAVNTGGKQLYGTQPDWNCVDSKMQLKPLEDPDNVNELRANMGLNSVEDGLASMEQSVCR